jgi:endoglucanase
MFSSEELQFLETLIHTPSPVGYESKGQEVWMKELEKYSDRLEKDAYGSAAAFMDVHPEAPTVMLEAHCDEIGMVVQYISDDGFVYVNKLGGSDSTISRARRVYIHNRRGTVFGVTGHIAIHLQDNKNGGGKEPSWKEIYIDIGVSSKEEALELIQVGDPVTYTDQIEWINDHMIAGRALDNRVGGFILREVFRELKPLKEQLKVNVVALNSVQEEVGGYGARMMAYRIHPSLALVTDVTHATDIPSVDAKEHGYVALGSGPSLQHGGANHPEIVQELEDLAQKFEINVQHEATSVRTGTDTDSIFYQKSGIPSALISIPLRYMHSPVEVLNLEDVKSCVELMKQYILSK